MLSTVLIVEDDDGLRTSVTRSFERKGYRVTSVGTVAQAREELGQRKVDLVLLDIRLPDGSGLDLLPQIQEFDEEIIVVMMTAYPDLKTAVRAMKAGAFDFIVKPFELEELHLAIQRAVETQELRRNVRRLERGGVFPGIRRGVDFEVHAAARGAARGVQRQVRPPVGRVRDGFHPRVPLGQAGLFEQPGEFGHVGPGHRAFPHFFQPLPRVALHHHHARAGALGKPGLERRLPAPSRRRVAFENRQKPERGGKELYPKVGDGVR